uniref:Uncharacterized protein n=1 Tax=Rhizophora mucronata TaxID=61149 RepID=A0A2P2QAM7_RHIMU
MLCPGYLECPALFRLSIIIIGLFMDPLQSWEGLQNLLKKKSFLHHIIEFPIQY